MSYPVELKNVDSERDRRKPASGKESRLLILWKN
jgi:hypothetical protein